MSDLPAAVVKLWAQTVSSAVEVSRTYYKAMFETLTTESTTGAGSGEGEADATPRANATKLRLSELRDSHGVVHHVASYVLTPDTVPAGQQYTRVKVSVVLPATCTTGMLLATLLDEAGAPASDGFSIFVSMPT